MDLMQFTLGQIRSLLPLLAVLFAFALVLAGTRWYLVRREGVAAETRFRSQLILLGLTFSGVLAAVVALPVSDSLRGQLLSLIGILLSATIALSSTTFLGNALAGILLRVVKSFRMGDFIRVGEHFGRASERGLFHVEIQTPDRDLTTLPNLYLVTHPVKVVRESGTVVSATVSLGYDVPRTKVEELLLRAASAVGLQEPFVHILELGDFSVVYRIAGLLEEVKHLLSTESGLRGAMLDELHRAGIEIVSPSFMNTRSIPEQTRFIPPEAPARAAPLVQPAAEQVVFDKAEQAEHLESVADQERAVAEEIEALEQALEDAETGPERDRLEARRQVLETRREALARAVEAATRAQDSGE